MKTVSREIMLPVRDGVRLRTVIYSPAGDGPWPTLFMRTPYDTFEELSRQEGERYARLGYAYVVQFCRGTVGSEGEWLPNEHERHDGQDAIHWLAEQDWVGSIGIHGVSYMALTGWIIADSLPAKVKALYLCHYSVDRYISAYKGGLFRHDVLTGWAMDNAGKKVAADYIKSCLYRPHVRVDEDLWGIRLDWYRQWITNTDYADTYWHTGVWKTLREIPEKIDVPVCIVAGWYDHHLEGTILGYTKLNAKTKARSRLVVGAWNHDMDPCVDAHGRQNASINKFRHMYDWFHRILVEEKEPAGGIETYIIGTDKWKKWDAWPVSSVKKYLYLVHEKKYDGMAYGISAGPSCTASTVEYDYNPNNPVYTHGGETLLVTEKERGSLLQPVPGYRPDVISFVSPPLSEDICITGEMHVRLYVSSDREDTSFTARVMEVLPNGDAYNIRSSITTLAYRNDSDTRLVYIPGKIMEINIGLLPVTWAIKKGSSLRIDVSSSDFPEYAVHSNYPGIWSLQEKAKKARQCIYMGGEYPSGIEIPAYDDESDNRS